MKTPRQLQRDYFKAQLDTINLEALKQDIANAQQALADFDQANPRYIDRDKTLLEHNRLRSAIDHAKQALGHGHRDAQAARQGIEILDSMLLADERIEDTHAALTPATAAVSTAQAELAGAERVLSDVNGLLNAECTEHKAKAAQGADAVLVALRAGKQPTVKATSSAMLDTLTHAQATATAAVADAEASLINAKTALADAEQAHRVALCGATARTLEDTAQAYAESVVEHRGACHAARLHCAEPDVGEMITQATREVTEAGDELERELA